MRSDLDQLCNAAREHISVPAFPREAVRSAVAEHPRGTGKRTVAAALAATCVLAGAAAAAQLATQSHIRMTHSGGMVLMTSAKSGSVPISSEAQVRAASARLDFPATLPAGLPQGTRPIRLYTAGSDVMAVTYTLPGAWRASHHLLWIFLANPASMEARSFAKQPRYTLRTSGMSHAAWRVGSEEVIVVSNGLTPEELQKIEAAMRSNAPSPQ